MAWQETKNISKCIQLMPSGGLQLLVNGENSPFISELLCGLATALLVTEAYDIDFFTLQLLHLYNTNQRHAHFLN
jgi:hypothetical protein